MVLRTLRNLVKGLFLLLWNLVKLIIYLAILARIGLYLMGRRNNQEQEA